MHNGMPYDPIQCQGQGHDWKPLEESTATTELD